MLYANEVKLFGKWPVAEVEVDDISVIDYIAVKGKHAVFVPHTAGRYQTKRFRKTQCPIVERLVNSLMMHGRNTGKKQMAVRLVRSTFELIHLITGKNPVQVYVDAVKNTGPREDSTRIGSAGLARRQAVDVAPLRRVNQGIYLMCAGARTQSFRNVKSFAECLADEIMNAANNNQNSAAIKRKDGTYSSLKRFVCVVLCCIYGLPQSQVAASAEAMNGDGERGRMIRISECLLSTCRSCSPPLSLSPFYRDRACCRREPINAY